jgi:hypothetical protein
MILLYLPFLALVHFASGTALGVTGVLAAKAVVDMQREDRRR